MIRTTALVFVSLALAACEQHDQGADLSACKLAEMKTNYPEKVRLNKELEAITNAERNAAVVQQYVGYLRKEKLEFIRLCMRTKGWTVNLQASQNCLPDNFDVARCYVRADNESD